MKIMWFDADVQGKTGSVVVRFAEGEEQCERHIVDTYTLVYIPQTEGPSNKYGLMCHSDGMIFVHGAGTAAELAGHLTRMEIAPRVFLNMKND